MVTGHYLKDDSTLESVLLRCSNFDAAHTSKNIQFSLADMASEWGVTDKLNFVVTDNAANITKAVRNLGWKQYLCYGHTLNLIVQNTHTNIHDTRKIKFKTPRNPMVGR